MKYGVFNQIIIKNKSKTMEQLSNEGVVIGLPIMIQEDISVNTVALDNIADAANDISSAGKSLVIKGGVIPNLNSDDYLKDVFIKVTKDKESFIIRDDNDSESLSKIIIDDTKKADGSGTFIKIPYSCFAKKIVDVSKTGLTNPDATTIVYTTEGTFTEDHEGLYIVGKNGSSLTLMGCISDVNESIKTVTVDRNISAAFTANTSFYIVKDFAGVFKSTPEISPQVSFSITAVVYKNITGVKNIYEYNDIEKMFGSQSVTNPVTNLAFGSMLFNTISNTAFKIYALDIVSECEGKQRSSSDTDISYLINNFTLWTKALQKLRTISTAYFIIPLTFDETILSAYNSHVQVCSSYEERKTRRLYMSSTIRNITVDILKRYGNYWGKKGLETTGDSFNKYSDENISSFTSMEAVVDRLITSAKRANSEFVTVTAPDFAVMGDVRIEGYFISLIHAARMCYYTSSLENLGYGMTGEVYPYITGLPTIHFFSENDKETIKNNGITLVNQDMDGGVVSCYAQNTTNTNSTSEKEESLVICRHFLSKQIIKQLSPRISTGKYNRISRDATDDASKKYLSLINQDIMTIVYNYVKVFEVFASIEVIGITPSKESDGVINYELQVKELYNVNRANGTIYII